MVFAPQRLRNTASSTFSIGRERTVFWGICPCSRHGAKTQWRRRYSPRAHRLARLVVLMRSFAMAHSCPPRGIAPLLTLPRSISPGRSSLYSYFSPNACPASWRKKLAAELAGHASEFGQRDGACVHPGDLLEAAVHHTEYRAPIVAACGRSGRCPLGTRAR